MSDKRINYITNDRIYLNNARNMRITQKIYGFFGFCFLFFFIIMSSAHSYQYITRKIIPKILSFQFIHYVKGQNYFENKAQQDLYHHANLIHEHEQVRKLREHQEIMQKTPLSEIRAKLHFRGHKCVNCPEHTEEYLNSHIQDLHKNKLFKMKKKMINTYYINPDEEESNNSTEQYENFKNMWKNNYKIKEHEMFKEFDEYLFKLFDFTLENDIPYVIMEYAPNALINHADLLQDYIESNYIKLNMYNIRFKNITFEISDNIYKYHLCENYIGYDYIKIDSKICIFPNIFVFENGILISIVRR